MTILQFLEALSDGLFSERTDPKALERLLFTFGPCQNISKNELSFTAGIRSANDFVGLFEKPYDCIQLILYRFFRSLTQLKIRGDHGERIDAPRLPFRLVFFWLLKLDKVSKGPGYCPVATLQIPVSARCRIEVLGNVASDGRLLG